MRWREGCVGAVGDALIRLRIDAAVAVLQQDARRNSRQVNVLEGDLYCSLDGLRPTVVYFDGGGVLGMTPRKGTECPYD